MIPVFAPEFSELERQYLLECIDTGWISSQGSFISEFEEAFAARMGMPFGVACSNGTTALHLALLGLSIGPGDEVICPDLTFIAPANMIRLAGATAVLTDVDPDTWCLDPDRVEELISPRTRAILVVHAFGHVADMTAIMRIARCHGLKVIEDVAEAHGATHAGQIAGSFGDAACYSFFANKIITTGEGGIVLSGDAELDKRMRILRDHGTSREIRYHHVVLGFNYRMTNMQAAVGLAQLARFDDILRRRDAQAARYAEALARTPAIRWRPTFAPCRSVHWLATVTLAEARLRGSLMDHMRAHDIDVRPMVFPVHQAVHFRDGFADAQFPVSTDVSARSLHLPSATGLSAETVAHISEVLSAGLRRLAG